ncbi:MAG: RNase adapter RapZ, partial [Eubacteriales bacterium]|nr:RNase adapter RapZ [Eubacteriales bacterium]
FKESRRNHPLTPDGSVETGIDLERERMSPMRARSDVILDTTAITAAQLRQKLFALFALDGTQGKLLNISLISFGFKYGLPMDADLVFDIRFLPNPHYQEALRNLTGLEPAVRDYVMGWTLTHQFLKKIKDLLAFLVPCYIAEGKTQLIIAIGCTGGKHRSVTIANILATFFTDLGQNVSTLHRDMEKS